MQWSKILRPISLYGGIMVMVKTNTSSQERTEQMRIIFKLRLLMRTESLKEQRLLNQNKFQTFLNKNSSFRSQSSKAFLFFMIIISKY